MKVNIHRDKKKCSKCQDTKFLRDYYIAPNKIINIDGRMGICKVCLNEIVDFDDKRTVIDAMRMVDRPFILSFYNNTIIDEEKLGEKSNMDARLGKYMRRLSMTHSSMLTYKDSEFTEDGMTQEDIENMEQQRETINITDEEMDELINFWGRGFTPEEYEFLQTEYETYLDRYEVDSLTLEIIFEEASHQRLAIKRVREKGGSPDKELKTLQDLFTAAGIKPVQETGANANDQATFGTLIKQFENEHPIPEPAEEWKDVDGIRKYIKVWFVGHLTRMLGIESDVSDEYNEEINKYGVTTNNDDGESDE